MTSGCNPQIASIQPRVRLGVKYLVGGNHHQRMRSVTRDADSFEHPEEFQRRRGRREGGVEAGFLASPRAFTNEEDWLVIFLIMLNSLICNALHANPAISSQCVFHESLFDHHRASMISLWGCTLIAEHYQERGSRRRVHSLMLGPPSTSIVLYT